MHCSLGGEEEPLLEVPCGLVIRGFNVPSFGTCFDSVISGYDGDSLASVSVCSAVEARFSATLWGLIAAQLQLHRCRAAGECGVGWLGGSSLHREFQPVCNLAKL
jgi:hypothetical protein